MRFSDSSLFFVLCFGVGFFSYHLFRLVLVQLKQLYSVSTKKMETEQTTKEKTRQKQKEKLKQKRRWDLQRDLVSPKKATMKFEPSFWRWRERKSAAERRFDTQQEQCIPGGENVTEKESDQQKMMSCLEFEKQIKEKKQRLEGQTELRGIFCGSTVLFLSFSPLSLCFLPNKIDSAIILDSFFRLVFFYR